VTYGWLWLLINFVIFVTPAVGFGLLLHFYEINLAQYGPKKDVAYSLAYVLVGMGLLLLLYGMETSLFINSKLKKRRKHAFSRILLLLPVPCALDPTSSPPIPLFLHVPTSAQACN
jgi:hypothetical protein